ncbi:hypothetical protein PIB30_045764, partial [Stylosanthes scabra]|nr:hypothetical protein [Stylosanthes scabra]
ICSGQNLSFNLPARVNKSGYYTFIGSSNGVACIRCCPVGDPSAIIIWNPLTEKFRLVPDIANQVTNNDIFVYAFGFLGNSNEYRIMHLYKKNYRDRVISWSLYNSSDHDWREIGIFVSQVQKFGPVAVVANGSAYFLSWTGIGYLDADSVCICDFRQKFFFHHKIPDRTKDVYHSLTNFQDEVGLVAYSSVGFKRKIVVWKMKRDSADTILRQKVVNMDEIPMPFNPSLFFGRDLISVLNVLAGFGESNDSERTEMLITKVSCDSTVKVNVTH